LRTRARRAHASHLIEIAGAPGDADRVLVDAPCSELGTMRRGPETRWRLDPGLLATLPPLQLELLETAAPFAAKRLVYGTCTLNRAEIEEVVAAFDRAHPERKRVTTWRTLPQIAATDRLF